MNRIILKDAAKQQISGNIGILLLIYIIASVIPTALIFIPAVGGILSSVISIILSFSLVMIFLGMTYGEKPEISKLFDIFKNTTLCGNALLMYILTGVFTFLWSLLLIVPGIIKMLSYSMAPYILAENDYYMSPTDAIKESMRIMDGHKMDLFILMLSFIGWYLLGYITCGIAYIYVLPYYSATMANFYNEIKEKPDSDNYNTVILD